MRVSDMFGGKYLKAADIATPTIFYIQTIQPEPIGQENESKPVLRFHNESRGFVLNKVNAIELSGWLGDETSSWINQPIELFATTTLFSGRMVPCLRVRKPNLPPAPQPIPQPAPTPQPIPQPAPLPVPAPPSDFNEHDI